MKLEVRPRKLLGKLCIASFTDRSSSCRRTVGKALAMQSRRHMNRGLYITKTKCAESTVEVVLQINGKIRSKVAVAKDTSSAELERLALDDANIKR